MLENTPVNVLKQVSLVESLAIFFVIGVAFWLLRQSLRSKSKKVKALVYLLAVIALVLFTFLGDKFF